MIRFLIGGAALLAASAAQSAPLCDKLGFSGLLANCNRGEIPGLTLAAGEPLAGGPISLQSGAYYELTITADGSQELGLAGPEFFRAIWMNEIVINDIEIRPMAIDSFEFDDAGEVEFSFIAIKPGRYELKIPGSTGDSQRVEITIE